MENVPPAENQAEVLQNNPAFPKPDIILSAVTSQEITTSKLRGVGGRISLTCFPLATWTGLSLAFVGHLSSSKVWL